MTILPSGTVLPAVREVTFQAVAGSTVFKFCVFRVGLSREYEIMGDVSFDLSSLHCTTEATFVLRFAADDESKSLVISLLPSSTQNVGPIILCCIPLPTAHEVAN